MVYKCFNCQSTDNLYGPPASLEMQEKWLELFPDVDIDMFDAGFRICAEHFDNKYILPTGMLSTRAVPTKFLVHNVWCEIEDDTDDDEFVTDEQSDYPWNNANISNKTFASNDLSMASLNPIDMLLDYQTDDLSETFMDNGEILPVSFITSPANIKLSSINSLLATPTKQTGHNTRALHPSSDRETNLSNNNSMKHPKPTASPVQSLGSKSSAMRLTRSITPVKESIVDQVSTLSPTITSPVGFQGPPSEMMKAVLKKSLELLEPAASRTNVSTSPFTQARQTHDKPQSKSNSKAPLLRLPPVSAAQKDPVIVTRSGREVRKTSQNDLPAVVHKPRIPDKLVRDGKSEKRPAVNEPKQPANLVTKRRKKLPIILIKRLKFPNDVLPKPGSLLNIKDLDVLNGFSVVRTKVEDAAALSDIEMKHSPNGITDISTNNVELPVVDLTMDDDDEEEFNTSGNNNNTKTDTTDVSRMSSAKPISRQDSKNGLNGSNEKNDSSDKTLDIDPSIQVPTNIPLEQQLACYKNELEKAKVIQTKLYKKYSSYNNKYIKLRNFLDQLSECGLIMKRDDAN